MLNLSVMTDGVYLYACVITQHTKTWLHKIRNTHQCAKINVINSTIAIAIPNSITKVHILYV